MKAHSLFISDLHLDASRPVITQTFIAFIQHQASQAERLFILGDWFEYWAGDDDIDDPAHQAIFQAMAQLHQTGCQLFIMHGNRDFLMGDALAQRCHAQLLQDPTELNLYGTRVLLSHGDHLCTDDIAYQQFRTMVRQEGWQQAFLAQPLATRKQQIDALRKQSEQAKQDKSMRLMDVNPQAVAQLLRDHQYPPLFIHGHTHRPAIHAHHVDGHECRRVVLGDWYEQGSYCLLDEDGVRCEQLQVNA